MTVKTGILLCGHGSRRPLAAAQFARLAGMLAAKFTSMPLQYGYLELAKPDIPEALDKLLAMGCNKILAVPAMLFAAGHVKDDIPAVLDKYVARNNHIEIHFGRELGVNANMIQAAGERIIESLDNPHNKTSQTDITVKKTALVVVGRGSSDLVTNSEIARISRMLWEGLGFGWSEYCYCGVTMPNVDQCLEMTVKLGFSRVVVFPYLLFSGVLSDMIYEVADSFAMRYNYIEFIKASYLNAHPKLVDVFAERINEVMDGNALIIFNGAKIKKALKAGENNQTADVKPLDLSATRTKLLPAPKSIAYKIKNPQPYKLLAIDYYGR